MLEEIDNGIPNTLVPFLTRSEKYIFGFLSKKIEFLLISVKISQGFR